MSEHPHYTDPATGELVRYRFTREMASADCPLCRMDCCVQRVESRASFGENEVIIHGAHEGLS
jgi:hypothetical protein